MKLLNNYITWLKKQGLSPETIKTYDNILSTILKEFKTKEFNEKNIIDYLFKAKEKYSPASITLYRDVIKSYFRFKDKKIEIPKMVKLNKYNKVKKVLTEKRFIDELLPIIPQVFEKPEKVNAVFTLLFYTGIRRQEVINLKREDIDFKNNIIRIKGKGSKERIVPLSLNLKNALECYFETETEITNAFNIKKDTIRYYCRQLDPYFKDIHLHPHLFRSSFAVWFKGIGGDSFMIKDIMGHSSLQMTDIYMRYSIEDIKKKYNELIKKSKEERN